MLPQRDAEGSGMQAGRLVHLHSVWLCALPVSQSSDGSAMPGSHAQLMGKCLFILKGQKETSLATGIKIPFLFEPLFAFDSQLSCLRMARYTWRTLAVFGALEAKRKASIIDSYPTLKREIPKAV